MIFYKNPVILSIFSGVLLTLSWPVQGLSFLIFFSLIPLFFVENQITKGSSKRKKLRWFALSYLGFFIWNLGTTWWIVNSSVFGMTFAVLCNTSFYAILMMLFHWSKKRLPLRTAYIFLISLWIAFEKFHLMWDFSWPWLNLGNVFSEKIQWIQWYEFTGSFGGTLWVLLINIGLFEVFKNNPPSFKNTLWVKKMIPWLIGIAIPILISLILYQSEKDLTPSTEVLLLQPNINPYNEKYEKENNYYFHLMVHMTADQITSETRYIFTPETYFGAGFGAALEEFKTSILHRKIDSLLEKNPNIQLITGIQSYSVYKTERPPTPTANFIRDGVWLDFYNSALKMEHQENPEFYHKSKLVVGVENMPYKSFFRPILGEFLLDLGGTVSSRAIQQSRSVFEHKKINLKVGPVICYESIYGEFLTEYVRNGAHFLAIITNDAWWGDTPGHKQLLSYARLRAIENRRDIVRSANTGISAIINAKGEIVNELPYESKGVLRGKFSPAERITFYTQYGDYIARWSGFVAILFFLIAVSGRLKKNSG
ncbi:MAG: apolipoprotein N-acyltransferase [Bacteroidota bacterium]|nr:apolipoprotein N-acyltransferase [Bacteroidota bacterium]